MPAVRPACSKAIVTLERMPKPTAFSRQSEKIGSISESLMMNGWPERTERPAGPRPSGVASDQLSLRPLT